MKFLVVEKPLSYT